MKLGKMDRYAVAKDGIKQKVGEGRKEIEAEWREEEAYGRYHMELKGITTSAEWMEVRKRRGNHRPVGATWENTTRDKDLGPKSEGRGRGR